MICKTFGALIAMVGLMVFTAGCNLLGDTAAKPANVVASGPAWDLSWNDGELALHKGRTSKVVTATEQAVSLGSVESPDGSRVLVELKPVAEQNADPCERQIISVDLEQGEWFDGTVPEVQYGELSTHWSPDGRYLVLADMVPDGRVNLVLLDTETQTTRVLMQEIEEHPGHTVEELAGWLPDFALIWSNNSKNLVFNHEFVFHTFGVGEEFPRFMTGTPPLFQSFAYWDGRHLIYETGQHAQDVSLTGDRRVQVFNSALNEHYPLVSPETGRLIDLYYMGAYERYVYVLEVTADAPPGDSVSDTVYERPVSYSLLRVDLDMGGRALLWDAALSEVIMPDPIAVSPDGAKLAFRMGDDLWVLDAHTGTQMVHTEYAAVLGNSSEYRWTDENTLEAVDQVEEETVHTLNLEEYQQ